MPPKKRAKILVMEDDAEQAAMLNEALVAAGYSVVVCENATTAWITIQIEKFDLLIADIFVKERGAYISDGGVLLIGRVRNVRYFEESPWLEALPVLAISGSFPVNLAADTLALSKSVGANECLRKPISLDALYDVVRLLLDQRAKTANAD